MDKIQQSLDTAITLLEQAKFSRDRDERYILLNGLSQSLQQLKQLTKEAKHDRGSNDPTP